jgi:hypothetical protein
MVAATVAALSAADARAAERHVRTVLRRRERPVRAPIMEADQTSAANL